MKSDDENREFREAMSDIRPLKHDRVSHQTPKPPPLAKFTQQDNQQVLQDSLKRSDYWQEDGNAVRFCRLGVNHPIIKKLAQGKYSIHGEIDLHGLTVPEAKSALMEFLYEAHRQNWRCIRVIHGKGNRSYQGIAILRPKVIQWLQKNAWVLAFTTANPRDGGSGALYVLISD